MASNNIEQSLQHSELKAYLANLEKQLHFAKEDLSRRPKLFEMLVKSASHGVGASNLQELLKTSNDMLTNEDLRRKVSLIEAEIQIQTPILYRLSENK